MTRFVTSIVAATILLASLSGCGQSPYCKAVDDNKVALNSLGEQRTNEAYRQYARAFRTVANVAPDDVREDWAKLADVTDGVVAAQNKAGIKMEDMLDENEVTKVPTDKLKLLNDAYQAFNDTGKERKAVVENVKAECDITLT